MQILSLSFLYFFLPAVLLAYFLTPARFRAATLLLISLVFFLFVQPSTLPLMLLCVAMDYMAVQLLARLDEKPKLRQGVLYFSIVKNIIVLLYCGAVMEIRQTGFMLGVFVYPLLGIDCVYRAYQGIIPCETSPVRFGLYCCFFPRLFAGPLQPYEEFRDQLDAPGPSPVQLRDGMGKFLTGGIKVLLLGDYLTSLYETLRQYADGDVSVLSSWCMVLALALAVYYRFSGYSDIAQGVALLFGLKLPGNFYYPYQSQGIADFFERFQSSLWRFLNRTIYTGLQADKNGPLADTLNLLVLGMLFGLWFGMRINCLFWGALLALFAAAERYLFRGFFKNVPTLFRRFYSNVIVLASFAVFAGESPGQSIRYLRNLWFLPSVPLYNNRILYLISTNWFLILISVFFATSIVEFVIHFFEKTLPKTYGALFLAADGVMLVIVTALLY